MNIEYLELKIELTNELKKKIKTLKEKYDVNLTDLFKSSIDMKLELEDEEIEDYKGKFMFIKKEDLEEKCTCHEIPNIAKELIKYKQKRMEN